MKQWPVQNAKNKLDLVMERAQTKGPQTITRHGKPMGVVLAVDESQRLRAPEETPLEFFSRFKGLSRGLIRSKDLPRKVEA